MYVSLNGIIREENEALIPGVSDGLFYGAGCFETFKSYGGLFLHFDQHLDRLNGGIHFLTGSSDIRLSSEKIRAEIQNLLEKNGLSDTEAKVRIQISISDRTGYSASARTEMVRVITAEKILNPSGPRTLALSDVHVVPASCRPAHYKLSNMLHYRRAGIEAKKSGVDDAVMLTVDELIAETSVANLFWVTHGIVYTPSRGCDILPGIMRSILLKLLQEMNVTVVEGTFLTSDVMKSRQIWVTNSVMEIEQVSAIDDKELDTDTKLYSAVLRELQRYKKNHLK